MLPAMAAYSSVLSRKEQGEEREEAHKADTWALFPALIFLHGPTGLNGSVEQAHCCQHCQNRLSASVSIKIPKYVAYREHSKQ